jgi:hypothetical protein
LGGFCHGELFGGFCHGERGRVLQNPGWRVRTEVCDARAEQLHSIGHAVGVVTSAAHKDTRWGRGFTSDTQGGGGHEDD